MLKIKLYIIAVLYLIPAFKGEKYDKQNIAAIITNQMPPQVNRGGRVESRCGKPRETPEIIKCEAPDGFPATTAMCHCTNCGLMMKLTCFSDGNWYPSETNVCSLKNPKTKCGLCNTQKRPNNLDCIEDPLNGYKDEERHCLCKVDCLEVTIKCSEEGTWRYISQDTICDAFLPPSSYLYDNIQNVTFNAGNYTFSCPPGFKLDGPDAALCIDGDLNIGKFPECIPEPETTTVRPPAEMKVTTTQSITSIKPSVKLVEPKKMKNYTIYIIVGVSILILIVIISLILIWRCYRNKQLLKQKTTQRSPVSMLEKLTNVKDFMLVNDMYKKDFQNIKTTDL